MTTPQQAAAEVAERAGTIALQTRQRVAGVIENMAWLPCPHCGERVDVFGSGGGQTRRRAHCHTRSAPRFRCSARSRSTPDWLRAGDTGVPFVLSHPDAPASVELFRIADALAIRERSLVGRPLGLQPV